ncbi:MAG: PIN domain-containing protein [Coriobacteriia bacterium]|nr:PIN domain-containing protein [Coriobacteriia bacterium]
MSTECPLLLLDTNVWIAYFLFGRPGHDETRDLLILAIETGAEIAYPATASKDLFYVVSRDFKMRYRSAHGGELSDSAAGAAKVTAWACVDHMAGLATAVPCDHTDVWLAGKQRKLHGDYEDDLVIAAAMRSGADLLVTYDEELRAHATVATATPAMAMTWLEGLAAEGGKAPA